jgi:hypothetical protein
MKRFSKITLMLSVFALIVLQGWTDDDDYYSYEYCAVYMDRADLENSVFMKPGTGEEKTENINNPGKIVYKHPYLFINEKYKGVHIIDNTDPSKPQNIGFIVAPGCLDMAVKDNIIYLDNAVDLVSFDLNEGKETERIRNVFPEPVPPSESVQYDNRPEGLIVVEWVKNIEQ